MSDKKEIPIQNIYYLLCYAWNFLEERDLVDVSAMESPKLVDLFARILTTGTQRLIHRGFDKGYLPNAEATASLRGKINFNVTLKQNLLQNAKAFCEFDEFSYNVLHNRILKTTIEKLYQTDDLSKETKDKLFDTLRWLREVEPVHLTSQTFRRVQLHRNNQFYVFLMNICELVYENLLADEKSGRNRFRDFLRDEKKMNSLFENFVFNFYRKRTNYNVCQMLIEWNAESKDDSHLQFLPKMRTDVTIECPTRKIILDCKYYSNTFQTYYEKESIHSSNLYQIFAYVKNKEIEKDWENCEGILLYPTVSESYDLNYDIQGHLIRIYTLNLNQDWQHIEKDLLTLIK